jgi:hypothetical protein
LARRLLVLAGMNNVERALADDITRLIDRLATSVPDGTLDAALPILRVRLDEVERRLAADQASLMDAYARWRQTLDDLENLWALAGWRSTQDTETGQAAAQKAA